MIVEITVAVLTLAGLSLGLVAVSRSSRRQSWLEKAEAERREASHFRTRE